MEDAQLEALLADLESDRVERKSSLADGERIREAICAFANALTHPSQPGILFVGADDDGRPSGLAITDELLLRIAAIRDDGNIQPLPSMTVEKRRLAGGEMAVVVVHPALAPPVRFRGRTWIRVGPRRALATPEEERRLAERRRVGDLPFELRAQPEARIEDLDLELFREVYLPSVVAADVLVQNSRSLQDQLRSLRFIDLQGTPTHLGLLVLGTAPERFLGGAYLQFLRLDGDDLASPIRTEKRLSGPLVRLLRQLDELLRLQIQTEIDLVSEPTEKRHFDYPLAALEQLARNAILHRNYEGTNAPIKIHWFKSHVDVISPGGPFGQVTPENFGEPGVVDYRNLHLAEAMRALGYVQRFGVGLEVSRAALAANGNPPLELKATPSFVYATLRRRP